MTSPAYTIGKDELLLITTLWSDGEVRLLELSVHPYKAIEIQKLIDETVSEKCTVIDIERYGLKTFKGERITEDFDVRTWEQRCDDARREQEEDDEIDSIRVYNARRPSAGNLTHALQGVGAGV